MFTSLLLLCCAQGALSDYDWHLNPKNGHFYALTMQQQTWNRCFGEARCLGGNLATVRSAAENRWLSKEFASAQELWIGLRRESELSEWSWSSDRAASFRAWGRAQPQIECGKERWVMLGVQNQPLGRWRSCAYAQAYGLIELDFDPARAYLAEYDKEFHKQLTRFHDGRERSLLAIAQVIPAARLAELRQELAQLRAEKLAIIHHDPLPNSHETRAASDAVQDWMDLHLQRWMAKSGRLRNGLKSMQAAHKDLRRKNRYGIPWRAWQVDLVCAALNPKTAAAADQVRRANLELALRHQLDAAAFHIVRLTNEHRELMGVPLCRLDMRVQAAAQVHNDDMLRLGFFAHESPVPGRESTARRVARAGYRGSGFGENIHSGNAGDGTSAVQGWIGSPPHHSNMLQAGHQHMGAAARGQRSTEVFASGG